MNILNGNRSWFSRRLKSIAVAIVVLSAASTTLMAETDSGQFCGTLVGFADTFRISLTTPSGSEAIGALNFRWRGPSTPYQVVGTGSLTRDLTNSSLLQMSLVGTQYTTSFASNPICQITGSLNSITLSGALSIACVGGPGSSFSGSATIALASCTSAKAVTDAPDFGSAAP
jgi:hypothetical protein